MRKLEELGFSRGTRHAGLVVALESGETALPADYIAFLSYEAPSDLELGFKFVQADAKQQWEGQVVEFMRYESGGIDSAVMAPTDDEDRKLLPIAADAGGNYLYLDLMTSPMRVVDVSYETGTISQVASSFGEFIDILYTLDE
ncbi:SMI1/KNR4 family protein [Blastopirellula sp. JC732]|uniref:SMI1/KNR4 family protein n=1 Tax=Blastopirellula sediminis TaxID=2894196 RepID=A0A9X1SF68_9BACT|nr:SMI1/KNR4 family protein [Blastopirellula sediminis]MCC9607730.1 SMI1/KNR4 family protein [Blastopirellula sediminis]MCC9627477.1 SMI1/KNR4 family protein [Blastopirellula sediminis]